MTERKVAILCREHRDEAERACQEAGLPFQALGYVRSVDEAINQVLLIQATHLVVQVHYNGLNFASQLATEATKRGIETVVTTYRQPLDELSSNFIAIVRMDNGRGYQAIRDCLTQSTRSSRLRQEAQRLRLEADRLEREAEAYEEARSLLIGRNGEV